jgi:hypothetical protein
MLTTGDERVDPRLLGRSKSNHFDHLMSAVYVIEKATLY